MKVSEQELIVQAWMAQTAGAKVMVMHPLGGAIEEVHRLTHWPLPNVVRWCESRSREITS